LTLEDRKKEFEEGYKAATDDIKDDDKSFKAFAEGYKAGYRDGYQAAVEDIKKMSLLSIPKEIRDQMGEEGAQPGWPPRLW
jgi:flagellar biosynthesis/type III secretory pathway protein FliH